MTPEGGSDHRGWDRGVLIWGLCLQILALVIAAGNGFLPGGSAGFPYAAVTRHVAQVGTVSSGLPASGDLPPHSAGGHVLLAQMLVLSGVSPALLYAVTPALLLPFVIFATYALARNFIARPFAFVAAYLASIAYLAAPTLTTASGALVDRSAFFPYPPVLLALIIFPLCVAAFVRHLTDGSIATLTIAAVLAVGGSLVDRGVAAALLGLLLVWGVLGLFHPMARRTVAIVLLVAVTVGASWLERAVGDPLLPELRAVDWVVAFSPTALLISLNLFIVGLAVAAAPVIATRRREEAMLFAAGGCFVLTALSLFPRVGLMLPNERLPWLTLSILAVIGAAGLQRVWHTSTARSGRRSSRLLASLIATVLVAHAYGAAVQGGSTGLTAMSQLRRELLGSRFPAIAASQAGELGRVGATRESAAVLAAIADLDVVPLDALTARDIFGAEWGDALRFLDEQGIDTLVVDRDIEALNPWNLLDSAYFEPFYPTDAHQGRDIRESGDLDGDGAASTFRTLLPLGSQNAVIYPLATKAGSTVLTLRGYFHQNGTVGPVVVRVNGVEVAAIFGSQGIQGTWKTFHIAVPQTLLTPVSKVYLENLDRANNFYVESIGFGPRPGEDTAFYPLSVYRVLKPAVLDTRTQGWDLDGDGVREYYDSVTMERNYFLYSRRGGEQVLSLRSLLSPGQRQERVRIRVNDALVHAATAGAAQAERPVRRTARVTYHIPLSFGLVRRGWNVVKIEASAEPFYVEHIGLIPSDSGSSPLRSVSVDLGDVRGKTPGPVLGKPSQEIRTGLDMPPKDAGVVSVSPAVARAARNVNVNFGPIRILGYSEFTRPDGVLYAWFAQATGPLSEDYEVFVHFVSRRQPRIWFPMERRPLRSTRTWVPGQVYRLDLRFRLPPDVYDVYIGWRDPLTGRRLPVGGSPDNRLRLQIVTVAR